MQLRRPGKLRRLPIQGAAERASVTDTLARLPQACGFEDNHNPTVHHLRIYFSGLMTTLPHRAFVTGGTGYVGRPLITQLLARRHEVHVLVRSGSEKKLPTGCQAIPGDALDATSYAAKISPCDTFVQLVGVSHPNPAKAAEFRSVDLASGRGAIEAARSAGVQHFVYVSVAHPAPMMKTYIEVRSQCEAMIRQSGLKATILRPWYVLGPGHRWPYLLLPIYKVMELLPSTREGARRLGLVTLHQMLSALADAVDHPPDEAAARMRILEVPAIRAAGRPAAG